jgi:membrane protease YdiL (CAAX protease family)
MRHAVNWRIFLILLSLSFTSVLAVFPYVLTLQGDIIRQIGQPVELIIFLQVLQSLVLFSIAIFFGLVLANKINFRLPVLEALVAHKDYRKILKNIYPLSVSLGIVSAVAIYVTDFLFAFLGSVISTAQNLAPAWQRLLAAFYGGITEEILLRLFVMSLFVWVGMKFTPSKYSQLIIVVSIFLAAILFGLGHLPVTAALTAITPLVIVRAVVLNGIGGVIFGWLFWKKGLESAMLAHFTGDIFLLTLLPLMFGS